MHIYKKRKKKGNYLKYFIGSSYFTAIFLFRYFL